jgi:1-acyl-sn-glycerol-3-phosphate acyltransferase
MASVSARPGAISPLGWLTIALRLATMAVWLCLCVALHYAWRILRLRSPWPPVFLGGIAWLAGVDVTVIGQRPRGREVLLANHVSWRVVPAIAGVSGAAFVAHDGLAQIGLLRWLCDMNDTVFVARHDRTSVARQVDQVRAAIRDTGALAIFPEGTTSDGSGLLPFKSSLLSALDPLTEGTAVRPLWLDYGVETQEIAWIGEEHGLDNFLRILARARPIRLTVHFLPPLTGAALANRKTIAVAASAAILAAMRETRS